MYKGSENKNNINALVLFFIFYFQIQIWLYQNPKGTSKWTFVWLHDFQTRIKLLNINFWAPCILSVSCGSRESEQRELDPYQTYKYTYHSLLQWQVYDFSHSPRSFIISDRQPHDGMADSAN